MRDALRAYYRDQGILSTHFTCDKKDWCRSDCANFTGPKSAAVPNGYERHDRPRLLILSSDSGSGDHDPESRLPEAVRRFHEEESFKPTARASHWYRTHELAWYILWRLDPDHALQIHDVNRFFAHTNAAKCSENNPGGRQAKNILFRNCRPYLSAELEILCPDILVTQGDKAGDAVGDLFDTSPIEMLTSFSDSQKKESDRLWLKQFASARHIREITNLTEKSVFWLRTAHPTPHGKSEFWGQIDLDKSVPLDYYREGEPRRCRGWLRYADIIHAWWNATRGPWKTFSPVTGR